MLYFSAAIFDIELPAWVMRINVAVSAMIFFVVLLDVSDKTARWAPGRLFTMLFGKIMPKISLVLGALAFIYLVQMILGIRPDAAFLLTYYPYITFFYIIFVCGTLVNPNRREQTYLIGLFMALTVVAIAFVEIRQWTILNQRVSAIYPLLCNVLFLAYNGYLLWKRGDIDYTFTKLVKAITVIALCPMIGYVFYVTM